MKMRVRSSLFLPFLCIVFSASFSRANGEERSSSSIQSAIDNAFDALMEVQRSIPKKEKTHRKHDHNNFKMDERTAKKFIDEIDQLENMLKQEDIKKEDLHTDDAITEKRSEYHEDYHRSEDATDHTAIDDTFNYLFDVVKEGMRKRKRTSGFEEFLRLTLEKKKKRDAKKKRDEKSSSDASVKESSNKKRDYKDSSKRSKTSSTEKITCGGAKKECSHPHGHSHGSEESHGVGATEMVDGKHHHVATSEPEHVAKATPEPKVIVIDESLHAKKSENQLYDGEIGKLADVLLKRSDRARHQKLKMALSDIFQVLEKSRHYDEDGGKKKSDNILSALFGLDKK